MSWRTNPNPTIKPPFGSQIDPEHPLAPNALCLIFNEGEGVVSYCYLTDSLVQHIDTTWGEGVIFNGTTSYVNVPHTEKLALDTLTVVVGFETTEVWDSTYWPGNATLATKATTGPVSADWSVLGGSLVSGSNEGRVFVGVGPYGGGISGDIVLASRTGLNDGKLHTAHFDRKLGGLCRLFIDGVLDDYYNSTSGSIVNTRPLQIGGDNYLSGSYLDGVVHYVYIYSSIFHDNQVEWLYTEPYAFIIWPSQRVIFDFGVVGLTLSQQASWKIFVTQANNSTWSILTSATNQTGWAIFNTSFADSAWNVLTSAPRETAFSILNGISNESSWKILTSAQKQSAWDIQTSQNNSTEWSILTNSLQETGWAIFNTLAQDTAWDILLTSFISQATSWKIFNTEMAVSGWCIQTTDSQEAAWKILNDASNPVSWNILDTKSGEVSWSLLTNQHADTSWMVLNVEASDAAWDILTTEAQEAGWSVCDIASQDIAWKVINDTYIPEPVKIFTQNARTFIFSTDARTFIFRKER